MRADLPRLAAPAIGSAIGVDILETLVVGELLAGKPADVDALTAEVLAVLGRSGRSVQRDGKPVTDQGEARQIVADAIRSMIERRFPVLRAAGRAGRMSRSMVRRAAYFEGLWLTVKASLRPACVRSALDRAEVYRISPVSGLDGSAPSRRGIRPAR